MLHAMPKRGPFYGWYIVTIALVAQFVAIGTQTYAATAFLKPMTEDLGWTRSEFSAVATWSTVVMGVIGFFLGSLIDKRGPRLLMLIGGVICGLSLILTSRVENIWEFYLVRGVAQTVGNAMIGNMVVNVTVSKWFIARRGLAVSFASAGVSLGGILMTPFVAFVIEHWGWRDAWVALGILVIALITPSSYIIRRSPEDYGLHPDGLTPEQALARSERKGTLSAASEIQWTRSEAVRSPTLWLIIFSYGIANIGIGALLLHFIPFLTDSHGGHTWSRGEAVFIYTIQAWIAFLSKPLWGVLMDRFHPRHLSAIGFAIAAVGVVMVLGAAGSTTMLPMILAMAVWGFGVGGAIPLQETVWANYFGRQYLGKIRAVAMPFTILFGAGGPLLVGELYDRSGSYTVAFLLMSMFWIIGFVLILFARPPKHPSQIAGVGMKPVPEGAPGS